MQIDELILAFTHFVIWKWQNVKRQCAVISDIMKKPNAEKGKQQRGDSLVQKRQISIDLKSWKGQARGKPGAKKANIYWLKEWSHIGRHLLQRLFRNGWSRNNLNLLKKEKNKNTTSPLEYNPTHVSRTFSFFQGAHKQNHPPVLHIKREYTKGQMLYLPFCQLDDL